MTEKRLRCSFCGKGKDQVRKFIAGPSVYICNDCVGLCNQILNEDAAHESGPARRPDIDYLARLFVDESLEGLSAYGIVEYAGRLIGLRDEVAALIAYAQMLEMSPVPASIPPAPVDELMRVVTEAAPASVPRDMESPK